MNQTWTARQLQQQDHAQVQRFLEDHISSSMFLLSNLLRSGFDFDGQPYQGLYVGLFEHDILQGVMAYYWNGNIIMQMPQHMPLAWRTIKTLMDQHQRAQLNVLVGPWSQVEALAGCIEHVTFTKRDKQPLYDLPLSQLQIPKTSTPLTCRLASPEDLELLSQWRFAYSVETLGESVSPALRDNSRERVERAQQSKELFVLQTHEQVVSMSAFNAQIPGCVQIGGVYTPPEHRSNGYARALVALQLQWATQHLGATRAILFTDQHNIPAQKAYTSIGFQHIDDYGLLFNQATK